MQCEQIYALIIENGLSEILSRQFTFHPLSEYTVTSQDLAIDLLLTRMHSGDLHPVGGQTRMHSSRMRTNRCSGHH